MMNNRQFIEALDRHITGNYGEDQFSKEDIEEMTKTQEKSNLKFRQECVSGVDVLVSTVGEIAFEITRFCKGKTIVDLQFAVDKNIQYALVLWRKD